MVESGSTTTYTGNGHPFPNWLVYDSSLFEVKVNGKPAFFNAPPPDYDKSFQGRADYTANLQVQINNNPKGFSNNFNLFVNINEDGSIPLCPHNSPDTYLDSDEGPMVMSLDGEEGEEPESNPFNLDPTKPMYLYNADWDSMSGSPYVEYDIYSLPHIVCPELNLTLIYDADNGTWKIHNGGVMPDCLIEWRFKELHDINKSPVFLNIRDLQYRYTYIYRESMLNPMVSLIPNLTTPNKFEVHARSYFKSIYYQNNQILPYYKGQAITAWPDLHKYLQDVQYKIPDPTVALIAIPKVSNSTLICRINDLPSWIVTNTVPDEYTIDPFSDLLGFHKNTDNPTQESGYVDTDGVLEISNGVTTVRYNANNASWQVIDSDTEFVTIQLMIFRDSNNEFLESYISNIDESYSVRLTGYGNTDNISYFLGFSLANPRLTSKPTSDIGSTTSKFLNHERVASQNWKWSSIPNLEDYDLSDYSLYVNGKLTEPMINYGTNDEVIAITYYLSDLQESYTIWKANMQTSHSIDGELYINQTSAFDGKKYFLDGARTDNLDMNTDTYLFNRTLPVHIQWIYNSTIPLEEIKPLFVLADYGQLYPIQPEGNPDNGIYIDYFYDENGKTATLSYAPPINMDQPYTLSLAMKHERDSIYGWKKSGYTGPSMFLYDKEIMKNTIGYPIVIREEEPEEVGGMGLPSKLPLTFEANAFGPIGTFDVFVNGAKVGNSVPADSLEIALNTYAEDAFGIEDTGEEIPFLITTPHLTNELVLEGKFDIYVNGELEAMDIESTDFPEEIEFDNVIITPTGPSQEPPPVIEES